VIAAIADHAESGAAAVTATTSDPSLPDDALEAEIREVLGRHVRPGVARDGGDVLFDRFEPEGGALWIRMQGACGGCPSARLTLKSGVERIVRRYVPEVLRVEETPPDQAAKPSQLRRWMAGSPASIDARARTVFTHSGQEIRRPADAEVGR
jgi:Fe-S cluster biogenesis protein NfuA